MKIIGSVTSPYVRFVRAVCEELALPYDLDLTVFFAKNGAKEQVVKQHNPVMRVPVLVDGDRDVIDSRVIVRHLALKHGRGEWAAAYFDDTDNENMLSVIYGLIEAGILWFILKNQHPEIKLDAGYMVRSQDRIASSMEWLAAHPALGKQFGFAEMFLICALDWLKKRNVYAWENHPGIVKIHATYADRSSLVKTRIPADA